MKQRNRIPETASRAEMARILNKDERSITNYAQEGIPRRVRGKSVSYPITAAIEWYVERERAAARAGKGLNELDQARSRKTLAEAQTAELKLAEAEGHLIPLETHEIRLGAICDRLRNVCTIIPSKFLSRILSAKSDIEAQAVGEQLRDELLRAMQATADDVDETTGMDDADERDDEPGAVA